MPAQYNITLKKDAPKEKLDEAKKAVTDKGGKIVNTFTLIPGFTAEFPEEQVSTLENEHITVEKDAEVKTQ